MLEALQLLQAAFAADDDIPKNTSVYSGSYIEPVKEKVGAPFISIELLYSRANTYLPGMVTAFLAIHLYDTDQTRIWATYQHIIENYPIPIVMDQLLGANYRMDELHFLDARRFEVPLLTNTGGGNYHLPCEAVAIIKPVPSP